MGQNITLAFAGDAIVTRRLVGVDDRTDALLDRVRDADAGVVNLEVLLHDYDGAPAAASGGTYMRAPPWVADELSDAGFDLFAAANNHTGDYSQRGMEDTMRALEARDVAYAGLGRALDAAREPAYVDTPAGRVALVAACTTVTPGSAAGERTPSMRGRPGLAPLGLETTYTVPGDDLDAVRALSENLGLEAVKARRREQGFPVPGDDEEGFTWLHPGGRDHPRFVAGEEYGVTQEVNERDREATLARIRDAARQADFVVASLHAHEGAGGDKNDHSVPPFLETFARDCVDAGADAFVGHGPHVLRGAEVYDGAPVFYSLGDFAMENESVTRLPAELYRRYDLSPAESTPADLFDARVFDDDGERKGFLSDRAFWEAVVPVCEFDGDGLVEATLHPIELGYEEPRSRRGRPRLATGEEGTRILEAFGALAEPYGVGVEPVDGTGALRP